MTDSMVEILKDDQKLAKYISTLEQDIDTTKITEQQVDTILTNLLTLTDNFSDRRALKGQTIEAITSLLKLKAKLPETRVKTKKTILDMMSKKRELELKENQVETTNEVIAGTSGILLSILNRMDSREIHPTKLTNEELASFEITEDGDTNDSHMIELPTKKTENNQSDSGPVKQIDILDLQNSLDGGN